MKPQENSKTANEKNLMSTYYQKSYNQASTEKSKKQRHINISTSPLQIRTNKPLTPVRNNINSQGNTSMLATTPGRGSNNTGSVNNGTTKVREYRVSSASSNSSFQERQKKATGGGSGGASVSKIK